MQSLVRAHGMLIRQEMATLTQLLESFKESAGRARIERTPELRAARDRTLSEFESTGVRKFCRVFNPLDILLCRSQHMIHEDDHTDLLAEILKPNGKHNLGKAGLRCLLKAVESTGTRTDVCSVTPRIRDLLAKEDASVVHCFTRVRRGRSVVDICVKGSTFLILIENKVWGGAETRSGGQSQTARVWKDWASEGVGKEKIGILISPERKAAQSRKFVTLGVHDMHDFFLAVASHAAGATRAFLRFYADFYAGSI